MWRFIIGGIAGVVIYLITKEKKNPTDMTNTHNQFLQFAQRENYCTLQDKARCIGSKILYPGFI